MPTFREIAERMDSWDRDRFERKLEREGHSMHESVYSRYDAADGVQDFFLRNSAEKAYDDIQYDKRREEYRKEEEERGHQEHLAEERRREERRQEGADEFFS